MWCGRPCWRWRARVQQPLVPMPVRAAFTYKKKIARREYVRVSLRKAEDGALEAVKFPREGAGLLSSLVDTDGLVELGEEVTQVEPGQTVGFLSYASLILTRLWPSRRSKRIDRDARFAMFAT